ncbi:response regulator [Streptomyces cyaneochromogenes]|uniref:Response regulator n=1 Tax=Streptomyces cyaneochromogenes TaxID=2496836 RepID=A0A3S9M532_9ACTN|nr:fused response regulator/phosphatase [Streptomyces cyaneochromogenes]AZQ34295.1 response regulator [Streptomyces cyaneochromogenes]
MDGYDKQFGTTVMVVDDVPASRYAMGAVLRRAGHDVVPVASAGEALSELDVRLRAGALPDVALVDVGLPDMNGFELCRRVKSRPSTAALPVVHFSAMAVDAVDRCRGLDAGADAYLTVPAEPSEIQAVVRAAVRGARRGAAAETVAHRLTVLSEAIVAVQTARCLGELADAASAGAARLVGAPAVVFVIGPDGDTHCGSSRSRPALPDASAHESAARLITRIAEEADGRNGVHSTVVPAPLWPAGFFRPGVNEDARLILASAQESRAQVCIATPARAASPRGAGRYRHAAPPRGAIGHDEPAGDRRHNAALPLAPLPAERLAQATALAAEPLLMYQAERDIALTLQHSFLPQPHRLPHLPGVDLVVRYVPASRQTEIGGDFYAALRTEEGVLTAVGDVVGHSLEAATVMVEMRHALRAHCVEESDPRALAERLDRMLQHYHPEVTATVCLALVDPGAGRVRIANAGHIPPLVVREGGEAEYVPVCGPLLGLGLDRPEPSELELDPKDRLLMVTDGLIETRGIDLTASMEQLRTAATDAPAGLDALCDTLLGCFGRDREDDIAMLALRLG